MHEVQLTLSTLPGSLECTCDGAVYIKEGHHQFIPNGEANCDSGHFDDVQDSSGCTNVNYMDYAGQDQDLLLQDV